MSTANSKSRRFDRYHAVVQSARTMPEFALASLKQLVREEQPAFVTRTVKALVQGGHLQETSGGLYRWTSEPSSSEIDSWLRNKIDGCQMKSTPTSDRPRERLLANGAASMRTAELLAILVRTGKAGESALQSGEKIANQFAETLDMLPAVGRGELKRISSVIGDTAYCQIMAGIELGRRVAASSAANKQPTKITSSADAIAFCQRHFARLITDGCREEFHIVCLDTKNHVIGTHQISVGTLDASLIHPREVFRPAIKEAAATLILVHNHPSGDPSPSSEDIETTKKLEDAGQMVGITVLDHVVLGSAGSVSLREVCR
jgi:DNA repair protein RadC